MDHDRLFKELLTTFFVDFLELFLPDMVSYLDRDSIEFLDKEIFTDVTQGERYEVDIVAKARYREQTSFFLIHVENQAHPQAEFARRMFTYFARLHEKHGLPVYPVALFSYDQPRRAEKSEYSIDFSDLTVLTFRYHLLQLNQLDWHDFVERTNPIAVALMAKMRISPSERPLVKLACLSLLARLSLDPARRELISGFVDTYLRLTMQEQYVFDTELKKVGSEQQEQVMEIVTSWMEKGMEKGMAEGLTRGKQDEASSLVLRLLRKRLGSLEPGMEARITGLSVTQLETLAEAVLDFSAPSDLTQWLESN